MTESEAAKVWCPKSRISQENFLIYRGQNKAFRPDGGCIAGSCAMWIWTKTRDHSRGPNCTMPKEEWQGRCGLIHMEGVY